ncbi:hypothetical protein V6N11_051882 [Hibiscus sabdariffa]|uniref:Uncharacterized protein n=1 Tax=Hibiscus sabdariffa TaxID=183260 RepID=A0ABR2U971_9ROSI
MSQHILQLRNQLQRIEARQLQFLEETKVFQQTLINFLCFQFPFAGTFFTAQPEATQQANFSAATQPQPSANPSAKAGATEEAQIPESSSSRQPQRPAPADVPTLQPAPTMPDTSNQRMGKAPAGRTISKTNLSSPEEEEQLHKPAKRQRRYHIITADSDDDNSAAVPVAHPEKSVDPSLSFSI